MAVSDKTVPYEILLRYDDDGTLKGAHKIERRIIVINGEVVKDEPGPAQPLTVEPGGTLWDALSEAQVNALSAIAAVQAELDIVSQQIGDHQEARAAAEQARDDAIADRDTAIADRDALAARLEAAQAALRA